MFTHQSKYCSGIKSINVSELAYPFESRVMSNEYSVDTCYTIIVIGLNIMVIAEFS